MCTTNGCCNLQSSHHKEFVEVTMDAQEKVSSLRQLMQGHGDGPLDAYIVFSEDAHQSEYVQDCDCRRAFISGFTGSAGTALITASEALLWTDGRYHLQASLELQPGVWQLMKTGSPEKWIAEHLPPHSRVGVDPSTLSVDAARRLRSEMDAAKQHLQLMPNLVDRVWGSARPPAPHPPLRVQPLAFAGASVASKLRRARGSMAAEGAGLLVVAALDEVAWLLNIRGSDIPFNPVAVAYCLLSPSGAALYVDERKLTPEVRAHLAADGVRVRPYACVLEDIAAWRASAAAAGLQAERGLEKEQEAEKGQEGKVEGEAGPKGDAQQPAAAGGAAGSSAASDGASALLWQQGEPTGIWLPPASSSYALYQAAAGEGAKQGGGEESKEEAGSAVEERKVAMVLQPSPLAVAKAVKNEAELAGLRAAHVRDGVALVRFFCWLDEQMQTRYGAPGYFATTVPGTGLKRKASPDGDAAPAKAPRAAPNGEPHAAGAAEEGAPGGGDLTEVSVAEELERFRAQQEHFVGPSFATISAVGANAAIIHYHPKQETCARLSPDEIFLCDSGGQYLDGTTDVTRTMHFGCPSERERTCFTLVLKGYIALETAVFPNGVTGHYLDALPRLALWQHGLDYAHGTGHGVGSFLNVHEGPHLISFRPKAQQANLLANMTVTDEPGYYEDGQFGIRTENVLVIEPTTCPNNFAGRGFLKFDPITFVPIQSKLVDTSMLTKAESEWLNRYHARCYDALAPHLSGDSLAWLQRATVSVEGTASG